MNDVLNNAIPWIFGSAVFMGGVKLWWASKAKLDKLYPERPADPNANFFVKMINSFQNELLVFCQISHDRIYSAQIRRNEKGREDEKSLQSNAK